MGILIVYENPGKHTLSLGRWPDDMRHNYFQITANSIVTSPTERYRGIALNFGPHPDVFYAALALAAFISWKGAWQIVQQRRNCSAVRSDRAQPNKKPPT